MPSIRVAASFSERYNTTLNISVEHSIIELSEDVNLRTGTSAEIELTRRLIKDQLAVVEVELMRQLDILRAEAHNRERAESEAEQARKDELAGQPDAVDTPWVS